MTDPPIRDEAILEQIRELYDVLDPPPPDLDERVLFAVALESLDVEVARLREDLLEAAGARATERSRTITFDSASLTIMITIVRSGPDRVRLDGWLAPAARLRVELRSPVESHEVLADDTGRFVFDGVLPGLAQLVVHPVDGSELATTIVTPSLVL